MANASELIQDWPEESREAAQLVVDARGSPGRADLSARRVVDAGLHAHLEPVARGPPKSGTLLHPSPPEVNRLMAEAGFGNVHEGGTREWRVVVYHGKPGRRQIPWPYHG